VKRRLLNLLAAVSGVLCVATCVLWIYGSFQLRTREVLANIIYVDQRGNLLVFHKHEPDTFDLISVPLWSIVSLRAIAPGIWRTAAR